MKKRYGILKQHSYDDQTHQLITPEKVFVSGLSKEAVTQKLKADFLNGCWLQQPKMKKEECDCTGDALSGLIPCDNHMEDYHAPDHWFTAQGVWVELALEKVPEEAYHHPKRQFIIRK